ncbi:MAG: DUF2628 domain-containing protein [Candidatus Moraniibacteriota bacterium]
MNLKNIIQNSGKVGRFNLGAFLFNYLWLFINKCYLQLLSFGLLHFMISVLSDNLPKTQPFYGVPYYPYISDIPIYLYFIISLIIGFKGNDWAWNKFIPKNLSSFENKQIQLTRYVLIASLVGLFIFIIIAIYLYLTLPVFY